MRRLPAPIHGRWLELLETTPELDSYEDRTLYSTWNITYNIIEQRNKLSAYLVRFWAYLNKDDVWFELLKQDIPESPDWFRQLGDELCFNQAMRVLSQFGLVEPNSWVPEPIEAGGYSMHSCVHAWATHVLNAKREDALATLAVQCIASHVPNRDALFWWITQGRLRLHAAKYSCSEIEKLETGNGSMIAAMYRLGNLALDQDEFESAAVLLERALALQKTSLADNDPATLDTMNLIGALRRRQNRYSEAGEMYTRILSSASGDEDAAVAAIRLSVIYNLGCLHIHKDQSEDAKRFFQQALEEHKRKRDACDDMTLFELDVLDNMGIVHRKPARLDQAVMLHGDAIRGKERLLGRQHVSTLDSTYNLALAHFWRQDIGKCRKLLWSVYIRRSKTLRSRHSGTLDAWYVRDEASMFQMYPDEAAKIPDLVNKSALDMPQLYHANPELFMKIMSWQRARPAAGRLFPYSMPSIVSD
ncbi:hypothetical protein PWT90_05363 [Aphanocladium album]|nr:hypothetical protein PWT90_05363 [Aphanocladium album]